MSGGVEQSVRIGQCVPHFAESGELAAYLKVFANALDIRLAIRWRKHFAPDPERLLGGGSRNRLEILF